MPAADDKLQLYLSHRAALVEYVLPIVGGDRMRNTQFLGGEQINQGLELNVFGEPLEGVRLLGGVMFLNAVLAKTGLGTSNLYLGAPRTFRLSVTADF